MATCFSIYDADSADIAEDVPDNSIWTEPLNAYNL